MIPDHDKRDKHYTAPKKRQKNCKPRQDQRILARIPFAQRTQGIAQVHGPAQPVDTSCTNLPPPTCAAARIARIRERKGLTHPSNSLQMARALDTQPNIGIMNPTHRDSTMFEDHVPPQHTMGHTMWVGGDATKPWVWCTA